MRFVVIFSALLGFSGACQATDMPPSLKEMGCETCHSIDQPLVGPAWRDVAKRYRDRRNDAAVFDQLVKRVSRGGEGNWGDMPMAPIDPLGKQHDKIVEIMKFVLFRLPDGGRR